MTHDETLMNLALDQITSASRPPVAHGFLNPMGFENMCRDIAERNRRHTEEAHARYGTEPITLAQKIEIDEQLARAAEQGDA